MKLTVNKNGVLWLIVFVIFIFCFFLFSKSGFYKSSNYPIEYVNVNEQENVGPFEISYLGYEMNPEDHPKKENVKEGYQLIQGEFLVKNTSSEREYFIRDFLQVSVDGTYYKCYFDLNDFDIGDAIQGGEVRKVKAYSYIPKEFEYSFFVFVDGDMPNSSNYPYRYGYFAINL